MHVAAGSCRNHPGDDGIFRVVGVRTKNGSFERPIVKVCALPINNQDSDDKVSFGSVLAT